MEREGARGSEIARFKTTRFWFPTLLPFTERAPGDAHTLLSQFALNPRCPAHDRVTATCAPRCARIRLQISFPHGFITKINNSAIISKQIAFHAEFQSYSMPLDHDF